MEFDAWSDLMDLLDPLDHGLATRIKDEYCQYPRMVQEQLLSPLSPILTTASTHNHEALRNLGATHCFNYRDADVLGQIREFVHQSGTKLDLAFDTIGYSGSAHMVDWCCSEGGYHHSSPQCLEVFCYKGGRYHVRWS